MNYSKPVTDLIENRYSCRKFLKDQLSRTDVDNIRSYIGKKVTNPFQINSRFKIVKANKNNSDELKGLGTYGFIKNAPAFIIGAVEKGTNDLEGYGYLMERIVLFLTSQGLGSCWLGGSFNKSKFALKMEKTNDELVPAVLAVGYKANNNGFVGAVIRWSINAKTRKRFTDLFFHNNFNRPMHCDKDDFYNIPLEMVRLAPSASNKQPWRIVRQDEKEMFHFFLKRNKGYYKKNKLLFNMDDLQRIDMGIAMSHFETTAKEQGLNGSWHKIDRHKIRPIPELTEYIISWVGKR